MIKSNQGRQIGTVLNEYRQQGINQIIFNSGVLIPGVYIYRINDGKQIRTGKMSIDNL